MIDCLLGAFEGIYLFTFVLSRVMYFSFELWTVLSNFFFFFFFAARAVIVNVKKKERSYSLQSHRVFKPGFTLGGFLNGPKVWEV